MFAPVQQGQGQYQEILSVLQALAERVSNLERIIQAQQSPPQPVQEEKKEKEEAPEVPDFISEEFLKDYKENPIEALINLTAEIASLHKNPVFPDGYLEEIVALSRLLKKEKLLEKYADAKDIIDEIEDVFKEIPEIAKRPDAYEIAYKIAIAKVGSQKKEKSLQDKKTKAFVEGKRNAPTREVPTLTPLQKMICQKLGISEKTFLKYAK